MWRSKGTRDEEKTAAEMKVKEKSLESTRTRQRGLIRREIRAGERAYRTVYG